MTCGSENENTDCNYAFHLSLGKLLVAKELTEFEKNDKRKQKKERVIDKQRELLSRTFSELAGEFSHGKISEGIAQTIRTTDHWPTVPKEKPN